MKAAVYTKYGPAEVLQTRQVEKPTPKNDEVLLEVYAATVNRTDEGFRRANYFISRFFTGLWRPKKIVAGSEFAGKVVEIGSDVKAFKVGDRVFGFEDVRSGSHAQYMATASEGSIAKMPKGFSYYDLAAAGEGATYALNVIQNANIKKGHKVLVYGASGAIGSAAVQILKHLGAEVTAVCGTKNVDLIRSLGADKVFDYQTQDFAQTTERFDLIFDAVGKSSYSVCKKLLSPKGSYCSSELGKGGQNPLLAILFAVMGSRKVIFPIPKINKENMEYIKQLVETGAYMPIVDRSYPLDEIVEAAKYVETGQKTGNVVIRIR